MDLKSTLAAAANILKTGGVKTVPGVLTEPTEHYDDLGDQTIPPSSVTSQIRKESPIDPAHLREFGL